MAVCVEEWILPLVKLPVSVTDPESRRKQKRKRIFCGFRFNCSSLFMNLDSGGNN